MNPEYNFSDPVNVFECPLDKATLQLAAYSRKAVDSFLNEFDPRPNEHNDRWAVASSLIRYEIDWPLWHDEHRRARASLLSGSAFKDGARNAPTALVELTSELGAILADYESIWTSATPTP